MTYGGAGTGWTQTKTVAIPSTGPTGQPSGVAIMESATFGTAADDQSIPVTYTLTCSPTEWIFSISWNVIHTGATGCWDCTPSGTAGGVHYAVGGCTLATVTATTPIDCNPTMLTFTFPTWITNGFTCSNVIPVPGGGGTLTVVF